MSIWRPASRRATAGSRTDTLRSIEGIQGTNFADTYDATNYGSGAIDPDTGLPYANVGSFGTFNQFEGLAGDDSIIGNGNTRLIYTNATDGVTVDLVAGIASGDASVGDDTFTGVNSATGSAFADAFTGDDAANIFNGGGGNDAIDGGNGTDLAVYSGPRSAYTISFNTPTPGQIRVTDLVAGRDGTDTLSNIEALQFNNGTVLVASGTLASPIDLGALTQGIALNPVTTLTGAADDFVVVSQGMSGLSIDLGGGAGDTVLLTSAGFYSLNLANVENVKGTSGDDFVNLQNNAAGLAVDLGAGNNTLNLVNGSNTLSATNVQNINGTDFSGTASNDTLTLLSVVNGVSINLAQGANTLNLAAGINTLANAFGVQTINGSASDDTLTFVNNTFNVTVDLGGGDDTVGILAGTGFFSSLGLLNVEHLTGSTGDDFRIAAEQRQWIGGGFRRGKQHPQPCQRQQHAQRNQCSEHRRLRLWQYAVVGRYAHLAEPAERRVDQSGTGHQHAQSGRRQQHADQRRRPDDQRLGFRRYADLRQQYLQRHH